ncbi:mitochondrial 54S ribosomal protein bL19m IMG1 [Rhodotorula paludigena]|uniref:mitochondrial 54S ribosomal protein bL19m IMG1 n=1 Tax=Rhodotorula paludigena TaxID=86838 RepID=UPI00316E7AEA
MDCVARSAARAARTALALTRPAAPPRPPPRRLFSAATRRTAPQPAPAPAYPYATNAQLFPAPPAAPAAAQPVRRDSLLRTLNAHLTAQHPRGPEFLRLFGRRDKQRLLPGSVLTVTSYSAAPTPANPSPPTTVFSGVLIALRRRHQGTDLSIRLRNLVGRTGVEMSFKVLSPLVKDIHVVARAEKSGPPTVAKDGKEGPRRKPALRAARRAKMYFVRDQPGRLVSVAGIVRAAREREASLAARNKRR